MVSRLESEIARFEKGIELIKEGKAWDPRAEEDLSEAEAAEMKAVYEEYQSLVSARFERLGN